MSNIELRADPIASLNVVLQQTLVKAVSTDLLEETDLWLLVLKENLQNAIDAVRIKRLEEGVPIHTADGRGVELGVLLHEEGPRVIFYIKDQGIGMDEKIIKEKFATLFSSTKRLLRERVKEEEASFLLGGFGVGFWTTSMLADRILVVSKRGSSIIYLLIESIGSDVVLEGHKAMIRPIRDIKIKKISPEVARVVAKEFGVENELSNFLEMAKEGKTGTFVAYEISRRRVEFTSKTLRIDFYDLKKALGTNILRSLLCVRKDVVISFIHRVFLPIKKGVREIVTTYVKLDPSLPLKYEFKSRISKSKGVLFTNCVLSIPFRIRDLLRFLLSSTIKYSDMLFGEGKLKTTEVAVYELRDFAGKLKDFFAKAGYGEREPEGLLLFDLLVNLTKLFEGLEVTIMNDLIVKVERLTQKDQEPLFIIIESSGVPLSLGRTMIANESLRKQVGYILRTIEFKNQLDKIKPTTDMIGHAIESFLFYVSHIFGSTPCNVVKYPTLIGATLLYLKERGTPPEAISFVDITNRSRRLGVLSSKPWSIIAPEFSTFLTNVFQHGEYIFVSRREFFFKTLELIIKDDFCESVYPNLRKKDVDTAVEVYAPIFRILFPNKEIDLRDAIHFLCDFLKRISQNYARESKLIERAEKESVGWKKLSWSDIEEGKIPVSKEVLLVKEIITRIIESTRFLDVTSAIEMFSRDAIGVPLDIKKVIVNIGVNPDKYVIMGVSPVFRGKEAGLLKLDLDILINANAILFEEGQKLKLEEILDSFAHELAHVIDFVMRKIGITRAVHTAEMEELMSEIEGELRAIAKEALSSLILYVEFLGESETLLSDLKDIYEKLDLLNTRYKSVSLPKVVVERTVNTLSRRLYLPAMFIDDNGTLYLCVGEQTDLSKNERVFVSVNYSTKKAGGFPIRFTFRIIEESGNVIVLNSIGSAFLIAKKEGFGKYIDPIVAGLSLPKVSMVSVSGKDIKRKYLIIRDLCDPKPLLEAEVKMIGMPLMKTVIEFK